MQRKENPLFKSIVILCLCLNYATFLTAQNTEIIGSGHYDGVTVTTSDDSTNEGNITLDNKGFLPNLNATSRFLGQATLGADYETIEAAAAIGISNWLDTQFETASTLDMEAHIIELTNLLKDYMLLDGISQEEVDEVTPPGKFWEYAWSQHAMTSEDLLRSRVAFALSEIFVVSSESRLGVRSLALADYYKVLAQHAFGNYRDLLYDVSMHPVMGYYLTHLNNYKTDFSQNRFPDENYAREIMQLFSIGLYELNLDGSNTLDANGNLIPTYGHADIAGLAKIFTGLSWGTSTNFGENRFEEEDFQMPMQMFNDAHEPGEKHIVNGGIIPDRDPVDGMADVNDAIDHLFNHPNVGPFMAIRLIQRLVTSNPSPAYIERVATVFNDNGEGIRGDLKAVIRTILTDKEARDCALRGDEYHGMLREPVVRNFHLCRAFNAASPSGRYNNTMVKLATQVGQTVLGSPTVFNFFKPDFQPIGPIEQADLVAPEFQITNALTFMGYVDMVDYWIRRDRAMQGASIYGPTTTDDLIRLDLSDELLLGEDDKINELIERYNLLLMHGNMSDATRTMIVDAVAQIPTDQVEDRVQIALFLVMISPDYLIMR